MCLKSLLKPANPPYNTIDINKSKSLEIWAAPELQVPAVFYDAMKIFTPANPMFDLRKMYDAFK
jgi:hypothetical protein